MFLGSLAMKRDLVFGRIIPSIWDELRQFPESQNIVLRESRYDRVYTSFFGILTPDQKIRYLHRFEEPSHRVDRTLARIWKIGAAFHLSDREVLNRLSSMSDGQVTRLYQINRYNEYFKREERNKKTLHHIIPRKRGGTRRFSCMIEEELHTMLHQIFGIMLKDEKEELLRWYERPYYELMTDTRIPYRHTPAERLLLKNVRAGVMQSLFSQRLVDANEERAEHSFVA